MIQTKQAPPNALIAVQDMLNNNLPASVIDEQLKKWGLQDKFKVEGNKLVSLGESTDAWLDRFITNNTKMLSLKEEVRKLSKIEDEELIARALHGEHRDGKFIAVNCAGLPEHLVESILFGHVKGAFTSAVSDKDGLMTVAGKGTFFLDEIGELPMAAQAKFLRAIQEKTITKVGGDKELKITCRIVCATNRDIEQEVSQGRFKIDLYARISIFELATLPLAERPEDIVPIIKSLDGGEEFLDAIQKHNPLFNPAATLDTKLNVRSLQRYVKRFKVLGKLPV